MRRWMIICFALLQVGQTWPAWSAAPFSPDAISLPPGFSISLFADNLPDARSMASGPDGWVFVGTRRAGLVYALLDADKDFRADRRIIIAKGLSMPNGVAVKNGDLYVAEVNRIIRFHNITTNL